MDDSKPNPSENPEKESSVQQIPIAQEDSTVPRAEAPVTEATFPVVPSPGNDKEPDVPTRHHRVLRVRNVIIIAIVVLLCLANLGSYVYGYHRGHNVSSEAYASVEASETSLQVPKGATIIEQCDPGKGTQYVLPSDIPHGPVYDVYNGKVIGVEYMIGKSDLENDVSYFNLPLFGKKYNHIDIGMLSQGHAGYPVPHYHVDIDMISRAASEAITCK